MNVLSQNQITKSILEILGDKTENGYTFNNVPVLLNKDFDTEYPEIRVSPFITHRDVEFQKYIDKEAYQKYRHWQTGTFQIDIYSKTIIEAHQILDALKERIYDFFNLETLIYEWNNQFEQIGDNYYRNQAYAISYDDLKYLFKDIYSISFNNFTLNRVFRKEDLTLNTFYADKDYLYLKTDQNLLDIKIKVLLQGRLFENGDSHSDRGIHYYEIIDEKNLSALEDNEVERISFDLGILYSHKREREKLPQVNKVKYPTRYQAR